MLILKVFEIVVYIEQNIFLYLSKIYYEKEAIYIYGGKMKLFKIGVKIFGFMSINCICQRFFILFYDKTHENKIHVRMANTESRDIKSL